MEDESPTLKLQLKKISSKSGYFKEKDIIKKIKQENFQKPDSSQA